MPAVSPGISLVYAAPRVFSHALAAPDPHACRNLRIREVGTLRRVEAQASDLRGHWAHKAWDGVGSALILRLRQNIRPAPPGQDRRREADHSQNPLHDVLTQQLLPADVVVQRRGGHTEAPGQVAHRPRIEPGTARGLDGDVDNRRRCEADVVGPVGSGPGHQLLTPPRAPAPDTAPVVGGPRYQDPQGCDADLGQPGRRRASAPASGQCGVRLYVVGQVNAPRSR